MALEVRNGERSSRIARLRERQTDLAVRFANAAVPPTTGQDPAARAMQLRAEAAFQGNRQTIQDVDTRREEAVREVLAALERGGDEAAEALGAVSAQMSEYLALPERELVSSERALAEAADHGRSTP